MKPHAIDNNYDVVIIGAGAAGISAAIGAKEAGAEKVLLIDRDIRLGGILQQCIHPGFGIENFKKELTGMRFSRNDSEKEHVEGGEKYIDCDTVLLSVGLIPEIELLKQTGISIDKITGGPVVDNLMQTNIDGIFACGNLVQVYDLVDWVSNVGYLTGQAAALYSFNKIETPEKSITFDTDNGIRSLVPHIFKSYRYFKNIRKIIYLRVKNYSKNPGFILRNKNGIIGTINKPYAVPSEMLDLDISPYINKIFEDDRATIEIAKNIEKNTKVITGENFLEKGIDLVITKNIQNHKEN